MLKKQQFNVYLPPDLIRLVKHKVIDADQSLSTFVEESLVAYIKQLDDNDQPNLKAPAAGGSALQLMSLIYPTNIERSVNFYRTLGFTLNTERKLWAELRLGDAALGLQGSDPWVRGEQIRLVLVSKVALEELIAELQKNGVRVDHEIADEAYGRSVLIHDPDGNPILINEYDPDLYP